MDSKKKILILGGTPGLSMMTADLLREAAHEAEGVEVVEVNGEELKARLSERQMPPPVVVTPYIPAARSKPKKPKGPRYSSYFNKLKKQ